MTRVSENQAGGYPEGMDHEAQPVSGEPESGGVVLSASDEACYRWPGVDQDRVRDAFVADAEYALSVPVDQSGEALAWRWRSGPRDGWQVTAVDPVLTKALPTGYEVQPLYAAPVPTGGVSEEAIAALITRYVSGSVIKMDGHRTMPGLGINGARTAAREIIAALKGASNADDKAKS